MPNPVYTLAHSSAHPGELSPTEPLTVTALTARIKQMLEIGFAKVTLRGEVSRLSRPASGHLYFTIKDAHAAISAVCWRSTAARLATPIQESGEYIFTGHITLYEPRGSYQLVVSRIESIGAGKLAAEYERRKQRCAERGWFDSAHKQPLPPLPDHIGIVTSPSAAAFEDVKKVLATRPAWLQLTLASAVVQGSSAPASVIRALRALQQMAQPPQLILLVRGGGSIEDLWCFNDESLVQAIYDCAIPIITGIGHEIDTTLADLAADRRAATPSNAAEIACPARAELRQRLPRMRALQQTLQRQIAQRRSQLQALQQRQQHHIQRTFDHRHHATLQQQTRLKHQGAQIIQQQRTRLQQLEARLMPLQPMQRLQQQRQIQTTAKLALLRSCQTQLQQQRQTLQQTRSRLIAEQHHIHNKRQQLALIAGQLQELDPCRVLERGYSIAFAPDGRVITDAATLAPHDQLQIRFHRGSVQTDVRTVASGNPIPTREASS